MRGVDFLNSLIALYMIRIRFSKMVEQPFVSLNHRYGYGTVLSTSTHPVLSPYALTTLIITPQRADGRAETDRSD